MMSPSVGRLAEGCAHAPKGRATIVPLISARNCRRFTNRCPRNENCAPDRVTAVRLLEPPEGATTNYSQLDAHIIWSRRAAPPLYPGLHRHEASREHDLVVRDLLEQVHLDEDCLSAATAFGSNTPSSEKMPTSSS